MWLYEVCIIESTEFESLHSVSPKGDIEGIQALLCQQISILFGMHQGLYLQSISKNHKKTQTHSDGGMLFCYLKNIYSHSKVPDSNSRYLNYSPLLRSETLRYMIVFQCGVRHVFQLQYLDLDYFLITLPVNVKLNRQVSEDITLHISVCISLLCPTLHWYFYQYYKGYIFTPFSLHTQDTHFIALKKMKKIWYVSWFQSPTDSVKQASTTGIIFLSC